MASGQATEPDSPFRHHDFRWFFAARSVSLLGSSMAPVALAFAVLDQTDGVDDLGIVLAANLVPLLVLMLVGGAVADRYPRRAVLLASNLGAGLTQAAVAVILLTDNYNLVAVAALEFANGALAASTRPALRGIVPELVPTVALQKANSSLAPPDQAGRELRPPGDGSGSSANQVDVIGDVSRGAGPTPEFLDQ